MNIKLLLYLFEMLAGLKINFNKSEVYMINDEANLGVRYAEIFNCQMSLFPIKYLGVPVSPSRLKVIDWLPLIEKGCKRLDVWKGGSLSIAGRSTLITASLNNSPMYHMSVYLLPKTTVKNLDKIRRKFFWQGGGTKKKYHLVKWEIICRSKKNGGLGIKDLRNMNISLLCKWWWKLEKEDGLWQQIVKIKYMKQQTIHDVNHRLYDSPMWNDLLKVKNIYLQGRGISVENGCLTRFWLDPWLYNEPIAVIAPVLFELCENKNISVAQAVGGGQISFRRWLFGELRVAWENIWRDAANFRLSSIDDSVIWTLGKRGTFNVKSIYNALSNFSSGIYYKKIWKGKIPEKIKIFLWLIANDSILTKDNLMKRKWQGIPFVFFVIMLRPFLTCFFNALLLK